MYPPIEPYHYDYLAVSDQHNLYYEQVGHPLGVPVLFLHGGPGGGCTPFSRRFFDPRFFRTVLFDQRGSGKSVPYASISENTTAHLIADIEQLRTELGIEQWIVFGGSWGSTLALCYAIQYPDRVAHLVLRGIFLARSSEVEWLYGSNGAARIYPHKHKQFCAHVGLSSPVSAQEILTVYGQKLNCGVDEEEHAAAVAWDTWECGIAQLIPESLLISNPRNSLAIARIESHYFLHNSFLEDNYILNNATRIKHIHTTIINGRYDVICPPVSATELHELLPLSELLIAPDGGHASSDPGVSRLLVETMEKLKLSASL